MKISIITITYNNYNELKETIASLPVEGIESVIINGGGDKETIQFLNNYPGLAISEPDNGIADAFNKGICRSSGDAVMFLNSGDILLNKEYPLLAAEILKDNKDIAFVHSNLLYEDTHGGGLFVKPLLKNNGRGIKYLHPTMIVRKKVFEATGLFNTSYKIAMDYDFVLRMEKKGFKGYYLDISPAVKMEGTGKSNTQEYEAIKECFRSLRENHLLTLQNFAGFAVRISLFSLRKLLTAAGGNKILGRLKQAKYSSK